MGTPPLYPFYEECMDLVLAITSTAEGEENIVNAAHSPLTSGTRLTTTSLTTTY